MIGPDEFRIRWGNDDEPLVVFTADSLAGVNVPEEAVAFLTTVGLPESPGAFLEIRNPPEQPLPTAASAWQLSADFDRYREIGFNGSGDPLCLDESADGAVVYLNHDAGFTRVFVNSSVAHLAEFALAYRQLVDETIEQNGDDAFLDGNIPVAIQQWIRDEYSRIDAPAMAEGCFWWQQLADFETES